MIKSHRLSDMASALSGSPPCQELCFKQGQLCKAIEAGDASLVREVLADGLLDPNNPLPNGNYTVKVGITHT